MSSPSEPIVAVCVHRHGDPKDFQALRVTEGFIGNLSEISHITVMSLGGSQTITFVPAKAPKLKEYQTAIQHAAGKKYTFSYLSSGTAIEQAQAAFESGAEIAQVIRKSDGKVIYDGPAGIRLEHTEY